MEKKRILAIDDDQVNTLLLQKILEKEGYEVETAFDGNVGLMKVKETDPDLILLDVEMGDSNGYTFINELLKIDEFKDIPVIVLTAHEENQPIFQRKGVKDYLIKPIDSALLKAKIQKYLA